MMFTFARLLDLFAPFTEADGQPRDHESVPRFHSYLQNLRLGLPTKYKLYSNYDYVKSM